MGTIKRGFAARDKFDNSSGFVSAAAADFDYVELGLTYYKFESFTNTLNTYRSMALENDLDIVTHLPWGERDLFVGSIDNKIRERSIENMKSWLKIASELGAEKAVMHTWCGDKPQLSDVGHTQEMKLTILELKEFSDTHGVELCLENSSRDWPNPEDLVDLALETGVSLCIDTGHARLNSQSDEEMVEYVEQQADLISHFHLNDNREGYWEGDEHLPLGLGTIDFPGILKALPDHWVGTMTLEVVTNDFDYIELAGRKLETLL